ncbi:SH3 domain-containing protein [Oceanobacillus saliphilus]|uniref:SH3 domain-containing protein n=1 Tax=Oceanobacillus saliphilus TaxID=2925834 RepID=UPI00201D5816|nr:SH3 domain-containing protein [Oceanobacillus saliphilus]
MNRKGILFGILLILSAGFIAFVAIMQHNFMNPEIQVNSVSDSSNDHLQDTADDEETEDASVEDEANSKRAEESQEDNTITHSTRIVSVDLLNVRSGPGTDYEIAGVLILNQEVEVEDDGSEWVKITTPDFTGFVNEKYLTEE